MKNFIVETRNLKKYYQMGENTVKALDGVDFRVKDREFVAIIGKSGSGKSTLLHMLGGLDVPTEGEVLIDGKRLKGLKKEQLAVFRRRKIGFIFQNYNLVPDLNVYENVILPIELDGRKVDTEYVNGILELLGLSEKKEHFRELCPADSSRESRLQGRLQQNRRFCLRMSRPEIWILPRVMMCLDFSKWRQSSSVRP